MSRELRPWPTGYQGRPAGRPEKGPGRKSQSIRQSARQSRPCSSPRLSEQAFEPTDCKQKPSRAPDATYTFAETEQLPIESYAVRAEKIRYLARQQRAMSFSPLVSSSSEMQIRLADGMDVEIWEGGEKPKSETEGHGPRPSTRRPKADGMDDSRYWPVVVPLWSDGLFPRPHCALCCYS